MVRGLGIEPSGACSSGRCVHQLTHLAVAHPRVELGRGPHQDPQLDRSVVGRRTPVGNRTRRRRRIRPAGATSPTGARCGTRESNPASSACKAAPFTSSVIPLVGVAGVEPTSEASKAPALPLDDTPVAARRLEPHTAWRMKPADRLGVLRPPRLESNQDNSLRRAVRASSTTRSEWHPRLESNQDNRLRRPVHGVRRDGGKASVRRLELRFPG